MPRFILQISQLRKAGGLNKMGILARIFKRPAPSKEENLLAVLQLLSDALRPNNSRWAGVLSGLRDEMANECASNAPFSRRYKVARKIEGLFGGMGSLNDIEMLGKCERLRTDLFREVQSVLRFYWCALGFPSHTEHFVPLRLGASVRLVPGTVRLFDRDGSPVVIADTPSIRSQIWRVVRYEGPDITNMLSYLVQHDDTFTSARHESLKLMSKT